MKKEVFIQTNVHSKTLNSFLSRASPHSEITLFIFQQKRTKPQRTLWMQ